MAKNLTVGLLIVVVLGSIALFLSKSTPHPAEIAPVQQAQALPSTAPVLPEAIAPAAGEAEATPPSETPAPVPAPAPEAPAPEAAAPPADAAAMEKSASLLAEPAAMTAEVAAAMKDRVLGNEAAPVTIIEYASMTCSHCAHFATKLLPEVKKRLIDTGKAKLIFRDYPLDQFAMKAAMMARCVPAEQYFNIVEVIFSNHERWVDSKDPFEGLAQLGSLAGMDAEAFKTCTENKALETAILNGVKEAQTKYDIKSTPSFIFNDGVEKITGAQPADKFEEIVNKLTQGK